MVALWESGPEMGRRSNRCRGGNGQLRYLDPSWISPLDALDLQLQALAKVIPMPEAGG
jgi:hypothetical protein